ncbi:MAG: hypothetical protein HZB51_24390 [Chloroflexi bacterium]|nr:hypothetical protein [Chloroflexota bacterium]
MASITPNLTFYAEVVRALDEIKAPYMIVGGFAATAYGSTRVTMDVDMIVDLRPAHILALAQRFPLPRYYADPHQMRNAIAQGTMFNLIDTERGQKVDLVPLSLDPAYREAFARRVRFNFKDLSGELVPAYFARPQDVMIGKLRAWDEGRSRRHEMDIEAMLIFLYAHADPQVNRWYDESQVDRQARTISPDAWQLWQSLKKAARQTKRG